VVDGEGDGGCGRDVFGVCYFLKVGFLGEGECEKEVVDHVKRGGQHKSPTEIIDAAIKREDDCEADILECERVAFAKALHGDAHQRREQHIGEVVDQKERG